MRNAALFLIAITVAPAFASSGHKEFHAAAGVADISLAPRDKSREADTASGSGFRIDTVASLSTFRNLPLPAEAILFIRFMDRHSGEEVFFPVKVSQIGGFLKGKAGAYRTGTADEKVVAFIQDLSRSLKVRMKAPAPEAAK